MPLRNTADDITAVIRSRSIVSMTTRGSKIRWVTIVLRVAHDRLTSAQPQMWNIEAVCWMSMWERHGPAERIDPMRPNGANGSCMTTPFGVPVVPEDMSTSGCAGGRNGSDVACGAEAIMADMTGQSRSSSGPPSGVHPR